MFVSVIVRSYMRAGSLLELLDALRKQTYEDFEIVVVEQSNDPELVARIAAIGDERIRTLVRTPLGAPGARNEGIRHARGEILVFIDDDDLPLTNDWIADYVANYADPNCVGVCGRWSLSREDKGHVAFPRWVRYRSFHYTFFRDTRTLNIGPLRKKGIRYLVGNNFSVRRELVERIGGWDPVPGLGWGEEQSFGFRYEQLKKPDEYMVYDPKPAIWRRSNIDGGLARRTTDDWCERELRGRLIYYHLVVGHYYPRRFRAAYPLFLVRAAIGVAEWVWDSDNAFHGTSARVAATLRTVTALPASVKRCREIEMAQPIERGPSVKAV